MNSKVKIIKLLREVEKEMREITIKDMPNGDEEWRWMVWGKFIIYQGIIEDACMQFELDWLPLGSEDYREVFGDNGIMKAFKHRDKRIEEEGKIDVREKVEEMKETGEGRNKDEREI